MTVHETPTEALERRVRYAAEHPIEGLLDAAQLARIREWATDEAANGYGESIARLLLGHIDALERKVPLAPYEREP